MSYFGTFNQYFRKTEAAMIADDVIGIPPNDHNNTQKLKRHRFLASFLVVHMFTEDILGISPCL